MRYSTLPSTVNPTRPPIGVQAKPLPENAIVTVRAWSLTVVWHCSGKKRPTAFGFGASLSGAARFCISGQILCAPKFEKSHQRISGLALIGSRKHGHPTNRSDTYTSPQSLARSGIHHVDVRRPSRSITRTLPHHDPDPERSPSTWLGL